ncbi:MAG: DUF1572 family protein [Ignavibacteriales bacterium]|nr:DUF1572 family protein [Ignavibacteriales bacterium]
MTGNAYLKDCLLQLTKLKSQADRAVAQVDERQFFASLDPESNSIAVIMKHLAGNMRSRWSDFLTTDGEKPDRNRDAEFEPKVGETRASVLAEWERSWKLALGTIGSLKAGDLERRVMIRGKPHTVLEAINRQLTHYAAHVGQIILLAKHYAGSDWKTLSIPRGQSKQFEVSKDGKPYSL